MNTSLHLTLCVYTEGRGHRLTFYLQTGLMKFYFEQVNYTERN